MEGVNYVTCPRCESHVVFVEGDGRPPGACPHCGKAMEGFRQVACVKCEGVFETAVAAALAAAVAWGVWTWRAGRGIGPQ
ncbi:MAG: hypothetical protein HYY18_22940 [Planctomycetes bacterium]|nr:hypothetical protein [Planctomycetota bacterium]